MLSGEAAQSNVSHPLVPRLNLPRPDPNDEWREMMAQAQSYPASSSPPGSAPSSQAACVESSEEEAGEGEESESER